MYCVVLFFWMLLLTRWMMLPTVSPTLQRFSWGVWGGSITGLQNFLKDALTVLKATSSTAHHSGHIPVPPLLFFVLFAGAISAAFSGLCVLTLCMKRYNVTYSASMFVGSFVVSASIMSAVHYHTFSHLRSLQGFVLYPAGLVFLIIGVVMLAQEEHDTDSPQEQEGPQRTRAEVRDTDITVNNDPL
jgi:cytochrome b